MSGILDVTKGIICQQVNCQNVMGAGLAKAIAEKYPKVKELYHKRCNLYQTREERTEELFGHYQLIKVSDTLKIANIFSQNHYGNGTKNGICYTNASFLVGSILDIADRFPETMVYIPEKIGCGYGGGNWEEIKEAIESYGMSNIRIIGREEVLIEETEQLEHN